MHARPSAASACAMFRRLAALPLLALPLACGGGGGGTGGLPPGSPIPGKTFGGAGNDYAWSAQQTSDGGYVFAGFTSSSGAGGYDGWIVKLDASGNMVRERTFGTSANDFLFSVRQTSDGGYVTAGVDNLVAGALPTSGTWLPLDGAGTLTLRKLNADFSTAWETRATAVSAGASSYPFSLGYAARQTADGGYVLAGAGATGAGGGQTLLLRADAAGAILGLSVLPGEFGAGVLQAADTGFVIPAAGAPLAGLVKTDIAGAQEWLRVLSGSALSVAAAADGGYAVAGDNASNAGDVHVARLDAAGNVVWERAFGSAGGDVGHAVLQNPDGSWTVGGAGSGGGPNRLFDMLLARLDAFGTPVWVRHFGGSGSDVGRSVSRNADGGYLLAGHTSSDGAGGVDAYLVKADSGGLAQW